MIIYNKITKEILDSDKLSSTEFDMRWFMEDPDYHFIKATPQQEADYIKQQNTLQLANSKTTAINQLQTLKTTTIDKLRADNYAISIKVLANNSPLDIEIIQALDVKLDTIDIELAKAIDNINNAINQTTIDNAVDTFKTFL
jgi:hypothetical protein